MGLDLGLDIAPGLLSSVATFGADTVANLAHWVKADDLATLFQDSAKATPVASDGDPVGAWVDQIAAEYVQATTSAKPTYRASVASFGNQPALEFDGGDNLAGGFAGALAQPNTVFIVASTTKTLIDGDDVTNRHVVANVTSDWRISAGAAVDGGTPDTDPHIFSAVFNGASSSLYVDGVSVLSGDASTNGLDGLTIGALYSLGNRSVGHHAEILIYSVLLSVSDKNVVQNYLSAKYGLSVTEFS